MYGERMERSMSQRPTQTYAEMQARSRKQRWEAGGVARVVHPRFGAVVVPHSSNLSALMNAAEVWGCDWMDISDAKVWAAPGETPVKPPKHIMK